MSNSMSSKVQMDLLNGSLFDKILMFVIPLAASSILQQLFNSSDVAVVGHFAGSQALAAVGSNGSIINLIVNIFVGLSTGANAVIARYIGEGKSDKINAAVHTIIAIALISGFFLIFAGIALSRPLLELVNSPDDVIDLATIYLRIYFAGMPFIMLYNFGSAILRSQGDTRRPLFILLIAGIINVILNLILVIFFNLGVVGVAVATVISNAISSILVIRLLVKSSGAYKLELRKLKIVKAQLFAIMRIGIPTGLQGLIFSLSNVCILSAVNSFGTDCVAGNTLALNFDQYTYFIISAFIQASVTFTSQNFGAMKIDRCKKVFKQCILSSIIMAEVLNILYLVFEDKLVLIFSTEPKVIEYAILRLNSIIIFQGLVAVYEIAGATLRGMGYSMLPTLITFIGTCLLRLFWVFAIFPLNRDYKFLLIIYPLSWLLTGIAMLIAYFIIRKRAFRLVELRSKLDY